MNAHSRSAEEVLKHFGVEPASGLSPERAEELLETHGPNALERQERIPWWKVLARQFRGPMTYLLVGAAVISFGMGDHLDGVAILIVILINGILGFVTEYRAEHALEALRLVTTPHCRVLRGRVMRVLSTADVVPGDVLLLEGGDVVPADARLVECSNLMAGEAALTGESVPVRKSLDPLAEDTQLPDRSNCVYTGTAIVKGTGRAVVFATGAETELGKIGTLLQSVGEQSTPLEERLSRFSRFLIFITFGIAAVVIFVGIMQGRGILSMIETGIALAVAAVPEGLPFVATMTLALGVRRMAAKNALVRNLSAVETLGAATVVCTDKTGTLTMNRMTVRMTETPDDRALPLLRRVAVLCNDADVTERGDVGDPMETALLRFVGDEVADIRTAYPRRSVEPFDSSTMRMVTWHDGGVCLKGAPERVLEDVPSVLLNGDAAPMTEAIRDEWRGKVRSVAERGMRTLAFAFGPTRETLSFVGFAGIDDPPRPEVARAVSQCREAGIRVVMVTGDHVVTAGAVAREIGIVRDAGDIILDGREFDATPPEKAGSISVLARVSPEHKLRLVQMLQAAGEVTAMTGDGVNDAVALKQADVGIAMGIQGTEVSREASDIILQDDRFSTIVEAVWEGRRIFDNIRKSIIYLLCCNLSEVLCVLLSILLRFPSVFSPLQILWVNLVTDVLPALALSLDAAEPDVMRRPPKRRDEDILTTAHKRTIFVQGALLTAAVLASYLQSLWGGAGDAVRATEMSFHTLVFAQLFFVLNVRGASLFRSPGQLWSNPWLLFGIAASVGLQIAVTFVPVLERVLNIVPLTLSEWGIVTLFAAAPTLLTQGVRFARGN